jgi:hypothetical protein
LSSIFFGGIVEEHVVEVVTGNGLGAVVDGVNSCFAG